MKCASLPMYDLPEVRKATDAWWAGLAAAFRAQGLDDVPDELSRMDRPADLWDRDNLLLSQTCGYPLTHEWRGRLACVAAPCYSCEGCEGADYCSFVLVHLDSEIQVPADLRGARAAFNSPDSQSGYSALRAVFAPLAEEGRFFAETIATGGHAFSLAAVAEGSADVCAIDAVLWTLLRRHRTDITGRVRIIARSPSAPGLPYVSAPGTSADDIARLRAGLHAAAADPALSQARAALFIDDFCNVEAGDYQRILDIEESAVDAGYGELI